VTWLIAYSPYILGALALIPGTGGKGRSAVAAVGKGLGKSAKWTFYTMIDLLRVAFGKKTSGKIRGKMGLKSQMQKLGIKRGMIIPKTQFDELVNRFSQEQQNEWNNILQRFDPNNPKPFTSFQEGMDAMRESTVFEEHFSRFEKDIRRIARQISNRPVQPAPLPTPQPAPYTRSNIGFNP
jgi:hypothetical protein